MAVSQKQYVDNDAAVKKARAALNKAKSDYDLAQRAVAASTDKNLASQNKARAEAAKAALDKAVAAEQAAVKKATDYFSSNTEKIQKEDLQKTVADLQAKREAALKAGASTAIIDQQIATAKAQAAAKPAAKETTGTTGGKDTTGNQQAKFTPRDYSKEILTAGQAVAKMTDAGRLALSTSLKNAGYNVTPAGMYTDALVAAYQQAIGDNQIRSNNVQKEVGFQDFLKLKAAETKLGGGVAGAGGPVTNIYPSRTSEEDAKQKINDVFQTRLGRDATDAEYKSALNALWANEDKNPSKQTITTDAKGNKVIRSSGGTNTTQFLNDYIDKNTTLKTAADAYKAASPSVSATQKAKLDYDKQIAAAKGDPDLIAKIKATTVYGQGLTEMENAIKSLVRSSDAANTDEDIAAMAQKAYDTGLKIGSNTLQEFVNSKLTFGKTDGVGGSTLTKLKEVALNNGINLDDPKYADQVSKWVSDIKAGADPEKYYSLIRKEAGADKSAWVKQQLAAGKNLNTIYSAAINQVAGAFGLSADAIDYNDPIFNKIFTDKGPVDTKTLAGILHSDARWTGSTQEDKRNSEIQLNVQALENLAKQNGVNLATLFPEGVDAIATQITDGATNLTKIAQQVRSSAGEGKSKYVQDQLRLGKNLSDIYGTYLNAMADAFGVDAATIDINDSLLQQAFTGKGPMKITDFQNLVRQDARYGGTAGATSDAQIRQAIKDAVVASGAKLTDTDIEDIANQAITKGLGPNSPEIKALIRGKITYTPGAALTGAAGNTLQDLRNTAMVNGIDLDKTFGGNIQDWLQKIAQGESVDTYKRLIREAAKMGMPDNVKKMLDQGVDLASVYSPFRNIMGSVLEIDPNSIDINDPTLRSAIGPDKEMSLYEWQRALRKDSRWQYTNQARQEASDAALRVLRDFGFQG